jgi:vanillate O-demethylase monooxygenase subunit
VRVRRDGRSLHVERWIMASPAPPMFQALGGFKGDVDRWQLIHFTAPSHFAIDVGSADAGSGAREGDRSRGIAMMANHTVTPETETTCHYFWHHTRCFRLDDAALTGRLQQGVRAALDEDVVIIEAQQARIDAARPGKMTIDINADAGVLQARRIHDELLAEERCPGAGSGTDSVELRASRT